MSLSDVLHTTTRRRTNAGKIENVQLNLCKTSSEVVKNHKTLAKGKKSNKSKSIGQFLQHASATYH